MTDTDLSTRYRDKTLEASFALWNALLTINGLLLSATSVLAIVVPSISRIPTLMLVVLCSVSMLLLAWNFLSVRRHFLWLGRQVAQGNIDVPDDKAEADRKAAHRAHTLMIAREVSVFLLLIIEVSSLAWLIWTS